MRIFGKLLLSSLLVFLLAGCSSSGSSSTTGNQNAGKSTTKTLIKINYAFPVQSGAQIIPFIAKEAGIFKKYGLDVDVKSAGGNTPVIVAAMQNNEFQMATSDAPGTMQSNLGGTDNIIIASPIKHVIFDLLVKKDIKTPKDLKGKIIGITKLGSSTDLQTRRAVSLWGFNPDKDVQIRAVGDYASLVAALEKGQIDVATIPLPQSLKAKKAGFNILAPLRDLPLDYMTATVQARRSWIEQNEDTVRSFLKAYTEAIQKFKSDKAFAINSYKKFLQTDDQEILEETYNYYQKSFEDYPFPTVEGTKAVLEEIAKERQIGSKDLDPMRFINSKYVQELKDSGFIEQKIKEYNK